MGTNSYLKNQLINYIKQICSGQASRLYLSKLCNQTLPLVVTQKESKLIALKYYLHLFGSMAAKSSRYIIFALFEPGLLIWVPVFVHITTGNDDL